MIVSPPGSVLSSLDTLSGGVAGGDMGSGVIDVGQGEEGAAAAMFPNGLVLCSIVPEALVTDVGRKGTAGTLLESVPEPREGVQEFRWKLRFLRTLSLYAARMLPWGSLSFSAPPLPNALPIYELYPDTDEDDERILLRAYSEGEAGDENSEGPGTVDVGEMETL